MTNNNDQVNISILVDGTIKVETNEVGQGNHLSAEKFLEAMARLAGGETETSRRGPGGRAHTHLDTGVTHTH